MTQGRNTPVHRRVRLVLAALIGVATIWLVNRMSSTWIARRGGQRPSDRAASQKLISEKISLEPGQGTQYELNLLVAARVHFEILASPDPIDVRVFAASRLGSSQLPSRQTVAPPLLSHPAALAVMKTELLAAGRWVIAVERPPSRSPRMRSTTVSLDVTARP
jgi:hypothetical protein